MTPAEFRKALKRQGLTQGELARLTYSSREVVNRWYNGVHKVPGGVQAFLEIREYSTRNTSTTPETDKREP